MQYVTEDLSPTKKKVTVTVPVGEVDAALSASMSALRDTVQIKGFRRGKVPASIIEKRFHEELCQATVKAFMDSHITDIMAQTGFEPVTPFKTTDMRQPERGREFSYTLTFEVMPEFELPDYEGFALEQEETVVTEEDVEKALTRLRDVFATAVPIPEIREPQDGELVLADFSARDEQGIPVPDFGGEKLRMELGKVHTLPEFEALVKTLKPGEETEGPVTFPRDFSNPELAGRTFFFRIKLRAIERKILPDLDDTFAQRAGRSENMRDLRDTIYKVYRQSCEEENIRQAKGKLLNELLNRTDFPLPASMVEHALAAFVEDAGKALDAEGKSPADYGKTEDDMYTEARPLVERHVRSYIFLMRVVRERKLSVSDAEIDAYLRIVAARGGVDYKDVREYYRSGDRRSNLRLKLLTDKGMTELYSKAAVTLRPPAPATSDGTDTPEHADSVVAADADEDTRERAGVASTDADTPEHTAAVAADADEDTREGACVASKDADTPEHADAVAADADEDTREGACVALTDADTTEHADAVAADADEDTRERAGVAETDVPEHADDAATQAPARE